MMSEQWVQLVLTLSYMHGRITLSWLMWVHCPLNEVTLDDEQSKDNKRITIKFLWKPIKGIIIN